MVDPKENKHKQKNLVNTENLRCNGVSLELTTNANENMGSRECLCRHK